MELHGKQLNSGVIFILVRNSGANVYGFDIRPDNAFIEKTRIPYGWYELPGDVTTFFITNDNPIEGGKEKIFRLKVASDSSSLLFYWIAKDEEGIMLDSGTLEIKNKYAGFQTKT